MFYCYVYLNCADEFEGSTTSGVPPVCTDLKLLILSICLYVLLKKLFQKNV